MTNDAQSDHIRDRIRYWEGVHDDAQSGDYMRVRTLAREIATGEGRGVKDEDKIRKGVLNKAARRLETLRAELGKYEDGEGIDGMEAVRGLKWYGTGGNG